MKIRPGSPGDFDEIWPLVRRGVADMHKHGNPQWGDDYPLPEHYKAALADGSLFAACGDDGHILGVVVLSSGGEPSYFSLPWSAPSGLEIHKLVVDPGAQGQGVASALFRFSFDRARQTGYPSVRIDTYSMNDRMLRLIGKFGFSPVGEVSYPGRPLPFPAFEIILSQTE